MYNKSREKIIQPVLSQKTSGNIPRPPSKQPQGNLPIIKNTTKIPQGPSQRQTSAELKNKTAKSTEKLIPSYPKKQQAPLRSTAYVKSGHKPKQKQTNNKPNWSRIPLNLFLSIGQFCCSVPFDVYKLSLICSTWRQYMECKNAVYFWRGFKKSQHADSFYQFKRCLISELMQLKQKRSVEFQNIFTKLFNYGSTKENIPNKLISKLKLQIQVTINKKRYSLYPYKLRTFNFSSYLYSKIGQLSEIKFDMYTPHNMFKDYLEISINFYSRTYKVSHRLDYKFCPQQIADCAIKQKAFNYFLAKNLIITFFQGDNTFLYCFLEISVLELITEFRKIIKNNFQEHIDKKNKKVPMYKKLCETQFQNFVQYLKYQADFQLHMSYHNSVKQIFTHCDTKVYPLEYNQKSAYFQVKIDDTFQKTSTFMLDNKMGISEKIEDLYLLDFVLKDRDRFIIVFSGFIYARNATQKERQTMENYFQFNERPIKIIQYKQKKYEFSITIVQQINKNFIKVAKFTIFP